MEFAVGRTEDGGYVLRFQQNSLRAEVALTQEDLEAMVLELQLALPEGKRGR